jgi:2,5-dioxopentanoate dehydrogenase
MTIDGRSLVAGQPVEHHGHTFKAADPATGTTLEPAFVEASNADVDRALLEAERAFATFGRAPAEDRAALLEAIAAEIEALGDVLIERARAETGLAPERLIAERGRTCGQLRLFASVVREGSWVDARIDTAIPDRKPAPRPDVRRLLVPMGPVAVFGASNFPLAFSVAGGDTASALAAGNPVVVKAHEAHPGTSALTASAIVRAVARTGAPAGVFSLLHGRGPEVGLPLVRHPLARAVGFTGSLRAGRALSEAAAARPDPIPVFAEMGSVNPVFVLPGALGERGAAIAEGFVQSMTLGVGQFCTKPGLVFAPECAALEGFREALSDRIARTTPGTLLHAGIQRNFDAGLRDVRGIRGVTRLASAPEPDTTSAATAAAQLYATDAARWLDESSLMHEVFGPFALFVSASTVGELEAVASRLEGQLTATLHATPEDLAAASGLVAALTRKAGRLVFNGFPTGVEVCHAMHHGGPWPSTTDARFTSVGTAAILRFARPVCFQNAPPALLPPELQDANPREIWRLVNGALTRDAIRT